MEKKTPINMHMQHVITNEDEISAGFTQMLPKSFGVDGVMGISILSFVLF